MKSTAICAMIFAVMGLWGCEKRKFEFTANFQNKRNYLTFRESDEYRSEQRFTVTKAEILNELDLSDDAKITDVYITSVDVDWEALEDNQVSGVDVTAEVIDFGNNRVTLFKDMSLQLDADRPVYEGGTFRDRADKLLEPGIRTLANNFNAMLVTDFNLGSTGLQAFHVILTVEDLEFKDLAVKIFLKINGKVRYEECIDMPLGYAGDECDG